MSLHLRYRPPLHFWREQIKAKAHALIYLSNKTRIAYFNGFVLPHLDYGDIVRGDQPGLKSEMDRLQEFKIDLRKEV